MKVTLLSSFLAVADTCNFTKAAEALFTTQPTLSRHIAMLEEETGDLESLINSQNST